MRCLGYRNDMHIIVLPGHIIPLPHLSQPYFIIISLLPQGNITDISLLCQANFITISLLCQADFITISLFPQPISFSFHYSARLISLLYHSLSLPPQANFIVSPTNIICISLLCQANFITISFLIITPPDQYH